MLIWEAGSSVIGIFGLNVFNFNWLVSVLIANNYSSSKGYWTFVSVIVVIWSHNGLNSVYSCFDNIVSYKLECSHHLCHECKYQYQ